LYDLKNPVVEGIIMTVFISYSRKDEEFAHRVAADLDHSGANVWIDVDDIPAGMKWSSAVQEGLDKCEVMIVVISPDSMASKNVEDEWQSYLDDGKVVLPVLWRPARVHFQLRRIQYINFHDQDYALAYAQLHSELRRKGLRLNPLSDDDPSVALPVQEPLPERTEAVGMGGYEIPPRPQPAWPGQPDPNASFNRSFTPPPAAAVFPSQANYAPTTTRLLDYATTLFRSKNWILRHYTNDQVWFEGWSYGQQASTMYVAYGLALIFGLLGGLLGGYIGSRTYRKYQLNLQQQADGSLTVQGDLGSYTVSRPEEVIGLTNYVRMDRFAMNGMGVWIVPIVIGLVISFTCYACYGSSMSGGY
jgi:hypothetical protein